MKNLFVVLSILVGSFASQAEVLTCHFTEPFVVTIYDTNHQTLTTLTLVGTGSKEKKRIARNVRFEIVEAGKFLAIGKNGQVLQEFNLDGRGSNGMGDEIYPFSVTDSSLKNTANLGVGGCESLRLKMAKDTQK